MEGSPSGSFLLGHETGHSIARPIACGNRVPPQRTVLGETPGTPSSFAFQRCHLIRERVGAFQFAQSFAGTGFTQRPEKGRQPGGHVLRCWFDPVDGMAEFRKPFRLFFRFQLRQDNGQNVRFQIASGPGCRQQLEQCFLDALRRNAVQMRPQCPGSSTGGWGDGEAEPGREPVEPQDAQRVLLKAAFRLPHRPHEMGGKVVLPAKGVDEPFLGAVCHSVDGEIPPGKILPHIRHKADGIRVAAIGVGSLGAEGRCLIEPAALLHRHGAVLQAGGDTLFLPEQRHHLLRAGAGAEVPIVGVQPQQAVPDTAAHSVGRMARPMECIQQQGCTRVKFDRCHVVSSSYCRMICLPSKPHSAAGNTACALGRAASGSRIMGE